MKKSTTDVSIGYPTLREGHRFSSHTLELCAIIRLVFLFSKIFDLNCREKELLFLNVGRERRDSADVLGEVGKTVWRWAIGTSPIMPGASLGILFASSRKPVNCSTTGESHRAHMKRDFRIHRPVADILTGGRHRMHEFVVAYGVRKYGTFFSVSRRNANGSSYYIIASWDERLRGIRAAFTVIPDDITADEYLTFNWTIGMRISIVPEKENAILLIGLRVGSMDRSIFH